MNISGSLFLTQHITMRIALGEVSFQFEVTTRRRCQWKYSSEVFLGTSLKIIWFKPSDLLAIFVSNGQAKTPRPFPKAICTSFLNTISKSVVCFQVLNLWLLCYQMAIIIIKIIKTRILKNWASQMVFWPLCGPKIIGR